MLSNHLKMSAHGPKGNSSSKSCHLSPKNIDWSKKLDLTSTIEKYSSLSENQKTLFLVVLAHWINTFARDTYEAGTEEVLDPKRLRVLNELLHHVINELRNFIFKDEKRYPDEVTIKTIFEIGEKLNMDSELNFSFKEAFKWSSQDENAK